MNHPTTTAKQTSTAHPARSMRPPAASARPFLAAAIAVGLASPGCGSSAPENVASSQAALTAPAPVPHAQPPITTPPSNSQIAGALSTFMNYPSPFGQTIIGAPGNQLCGGDNYERIFPPPWGAGDGAGVWHDANTMEMLVDYQLATGDASYQSIVEAYGNGQYDTVLPFANYGCATGNCAWNAYNDDDMWWALAFLRAQELEMSLVPTDANPAARIDLAASYFSGAQAVFQHICSQWNSIPGGGVPQKMGGSGLNTITNELFFQTAMKLYLADPGATNVCSTQTNPSGNDYLGWAASEYLLFQNDWWGGMAPYLVSLMPDAFPDDPPTYWTYNQGPILGALLDFANAPRPDRDARLVPDTDQTILGYGYAIVTNVIAPDGYFAPNGTLTEANMPDQLCVTSGSGPGDCPEFKGILMRYLARFLNGAQRGDPSNYLTDTYAGDGFIATNAARIYQHNSAGLLSEDWGAYGPYPSGIAWATQTMETAGMDGLIAAVGLVVPPAPPTLGVTSVSETTGYTGDTLAMTGSLFSTAPGGTAVTFFSPTNATSPTLSASVACSTSSFCFVTVPPGAGTYDIQVTVNGATVAAPSSFTYEPPYVSSISPASGTTLGNTSVYISGRGLDDSMAVLFGGTAVVPVCAGNTLCGVFSPPGKAGVVDIVVSSGGLSSANTAADQFTYVYVPLATGVSVPGGALWTSENTTGTVTLNEVAGAGGALVTLSVTDPTGAGRPTGVTVPATVTVPAGSAAVTFPISVDAAPLGEVTLGASINGGAVSAEELVFSGQIALSFVYTPGSDGPLTPGDTGTFSLWVRSSPAVATGASAAITNTNPTDLSVPASVAIPYEGGSTNGASASFTGMCKTTLVADASAVVTVTYGSVSESVTVNMAKGITLPPTCKPGVACNPI